MARNRIDIKNQLTAGLVNNSHIAAAYGLEEGKTFDQEFSLVSFENILFDIISYAIFFLELLFVQHKKEVTQEIKAQKSGRLQWYRTKALEFQYGFDLVTDQDYYDNTGFTQEQIEVSRIIKQSAVTDSEEVGRIIIKIAGEVNDKLAPITDDQRDSVVAYFADIKWAGTDINVINNLPDKLLLDLVIYRNPLVLDSVGNSILNGGKPVETALLEYMKELPFNGQLVLTHLIDKLQLVDGVENVHLISASSSWIDPVINAYGVPTGISVKRVPESGYYEIVDFDNITYVV